MNPSICLEHYFAAWNSADDAARRHHLGAALSADFHYLDPHRAARGIDAFAHSLAEFHAQSPGSFVERISGLDAHHNLYRYAWRLVRGGQRVVEGLDMIEFNDAGLIHIVRSFFGPLPAI